MIDARHLADYASDAAFSIDGGQRVVAWNYGAQQLMGYTRSEVLGRHCSEVLQAIFPDGEPLCVHNCDGARCFRTFQTFDVPACSVRHKDGKWVAAFYFLCLVMNWWYYLGPKREFDNP